LNACDALACITGATVIVDGSKYASEAALLLASGRVRVKILHLVRDPRAVALSWAKPKDYIKPMSAWRSTGNWLAFNAAGHALQQAYPQDVMFLRYEDFTEEPELTITRILQMMETDPALNPVSGRHAVLSGNHTVTGNPDRMQSGPVSIRNTSAGNASFSWRGLISTLVSTPQRVRYGYR